jgi:AcrR family transcriptional regulator
MEKDTMLFESSTSDIPTKQRILICAVNLFCEKGYSETAIRDIASAVGIQAASIYNHFPSKEALLMFMLNDYTEYTRNIFQTQDILSILKEDPTPKGITKCLLSCISVLTENDYYFKLYNMIQQEKHYHSIIAEFHLKRFYETKEYIKKIIEVLKNLNVVAKDINADYWGVIIFSLLYALSSIITKQKTLGYTQKDISDILCYIFDAMLLSNKVED